MAAESSRSSSSGADSYIGSLISLTSKSEIRYEGILYNINTEESSIGLRNVRSFGTEGRKKDGPQVGPSDKVYEYILFRGSDIKDLQVKSSPPAQSTPAPPINSDPAIIQSHYPRPATTTSSLPAAATTGSLADTSSHNSQLGHPGSTFQSGLPLYQPGGNLGSWGPSPPPNANGSGLAMPMYWPGYYGPPSGLPQMHPQSMLRPPSGMPVPPPSMQQPLQYPGFTASLPAGASNLPPPNLPTSNLPTSNFPFSNMLTSNLPEYPSSLLPAPASSSVLTSTSYPSSSLPSSLPPVPLLGLPSETLPSLTTNKAPNTVGPTVPLGGSLPSLSPLATSTPDINAIAPPISNKSNVISSPSLSYQGISHPVSSVVGTSANQSESPIPSLITPGQLLHSGHGAVPSYQSSQFAHKDVEVVQVAPVPVSEPSAPATVPTEARPPILPTPSRPAQKMNGAPYQNRNNYRGRERGRGSGPSHPVMKFTEEFDFTAMNEKFNKDEVWGHLGKSNKSNLKDKGDGYVTDEEEYEDEDDSELPKVDTKPVYSKDDFFDTLSCNALDNQSNNGRPRFSEQMKLDTETFGEFSRYRGGRGGRGPYRGGGGRGPYRGGGYYRGGGGGYGYNGRGRGGRTPNREY